jgi:hypothetical protein
MSDKEIIAAQAEEIASLKARLKILNDAWHAHEAQIARLEYLLEQKQNADAK